MAASEVLVEAFFSEEDPFSLHPQAGQQAGLSTSVVQLLPTTTRLLSYRKFPAFQRDIKPLSLWSFASLAVVVSSVGLHSSCCYDSAISVVQLYSIGYVCSPRTLED